VFCRERDLAEVLHVCKSNPRLHPTVVGDLENLHNHLTFWNQYLVDASGEKYVGEGYVDSKHLKFNERSVPYWRRVSAVNNLEKLLARNYEISSRETTRFNMCVNGCVSEKDLFFEMEILKAYLPPCESAVVAGGYFRDFAMGEKAKDIDVFLIDEDEYLAIVDELHDCVEETGLVRRIPVTKLQIEGLRVDIVDYSFLRKKEHVVDMFDFTINTIWMDLEDGSLHNVDGIRDICNRRLRMTDNAWFRSSPVRLEKRWRRFVDMGFKPTASAVSKKQEYEGMVYGTIALEKY
jgi:hypothetical protein